MEIFLQIQGSINCNIQQHKVKSCKKKKKKKVTWICTSTSFPLSLISTQYIITGITNIQWQRSKQCAANIFHYYSWLECCYQFLMHTKISSRCFIKHKTSPDILLSPYHLFFITLCITLHKLKALYHDSKTNRQKQKFKLISPIYS